MWLCPQDTWRSVCFWLLRPHFLCLSTSLSLCLCGQQVLGPFCLRIHDIQQLNLGLGTAKGKPTLGLHPPGGLCVWGALCLALGPPTLSRRPDSSRRFCFYLQVKQSQSDLLLPHSPDGSASSQRCVLCHRGAPRGLLCHAPSRHQAIPQGSEREVSVKHVAGTSLSNSAPQRPYGLSNGDCTRTCPLGFSGELNARVTARSVRGTAPGPWRGLSVSRTAALTFPSAAHSCLQKGLVR